MGAQGDRTTRCVVRDSAIEYARRTGLITSSVSEVEECSVIESVRKLLALGLSTKEIDDLDIREPMLQAVCEYARLGTEGDEPTEHATAAVEKTLHVITEQMQNLDLEIEMLSLRRRALKRRTRVLEKLAQTLSGGDS